MKKSIVLGLVLMVACTASLFAKADSPSAVLRSSTDLRSNDTLRQFLAPCDILVGIDNANGKPYDHADDVISETKSYIDQGFKLVSLTPVDRQSGANGVAANRCIFTFVRQ